MVGALAAALLMCSTAHAASFGHSRIVSALGQPLRIDVPVTQLSADDLRSISVSAAPASAWLQAGLIPPVDLASLQTRLADGFAPGSKIIQVRSDQPFDKPVADLLLDVRTASGQQRYQVSLLTHASQDAIRSAGASPQGAAAGASAAAMGNPASGGHASAAAIRVKRGDNMFRIARRHAVPGVTIYQMMIALQRANPQAFIEDNVNLVKAGATLSMPDMAGLTAISDREARRIFQRQAQAFALYRQRAAGQASVVGQEGGAASGVVSSAGAPHAPEPAAGPRDQLRLSGGETARNRGGQAAGNERGAAQGAAGSGGANAQGGGGSGIAYAQGATGSGDAYAQGAAGAAGSARGSAASGTGADGQGGASSADVQADDRLATRKGIQDSEQRVSQLEQNVKHLNEALQSQGEAAKDLLVDGAKGLGLSLPGMASGAGGSDAPSSAASGAAGSGASAAPGAAAGGSGAGAPVDSGVGAAAGSTAAGNAGGNAGAGNTGDAAAANGSGLAASNGAASNGATSNDAAVDGVDTATPGAAAAGAGSPAGNASASGAGASAAGKSGGGSAASGAGRTGDAAPPMPSNSNKAEHTVSWIQEHMLGVITGLLALIVLIIAWILRRANASHDDDHSGLVTEAMVKEKLDQINFDLEEPPRDDLKTQKS
ncbi:type IV pilus assembly protein FimV [Pollutimonas bauzanensis]|uniref:type IV pilus assembly protein FimV n=1 Tax=Pollutimonas bauzanensis TaxID=658167 RepID=UPI0015B37FA3|nr:FimV/HubP family polar landmark protein [Pollutimonas bauzanensis]